MMGAEVIKVGSARRPDPSTNSAAFQAYNQSKKYCALNLSKQEGVDLAKRLVGVADVVVENFAVGVFDRLGLTYEVLREVRPDVILVSSSGTGHTGPDKDYVAYGSLLQSYTGWNSISGHPDGQPVRGGLWADPWVGLELAMITLAALDNRLVTGQGQYIDFSMAEALTASIPETILDFQMNRRAKQPMGNRDDTWAPHGVYPCAGDDRWVAVAVTGDKEWRALCSLIGRPELAEDERFATASGRRACQDELDTAITGWTGGLEDYEAMRLLQGAGVSAGPSLDISRVFHGPQLRDGGYLSRVETSDDQMRDLPTLPWRFDDGTEPYVTAAPVLGQHNDDVYRDLLGLSSSEIQSLQQSQGIY
jgi:benzylsuccinate CoA-transferase BbsF subunit